MNDSSVRWAFTRSAAIMALAMVGGFLGVYLVFIRTSTGQQVDIGAFGGVSEISERWGWFGGLLRSQLPLTVAAIGAVFVLLARVDRRGRVVVIALALFLVPSILAPVLKDQIPRPFLGDFGYLYNTYPAGQTTAVASLCLTILMLLPARWDRFRAVLVGVALVLTLSTAGAAVVTFASRPSDVIGAILLVGVFAVPAASASGTKVVGRWPRMLSVASLTLLAVGAALFAVIGLRIDAGSSPGQFLSNLGLLCALFGVTGSLYSAVAWVTPRKQPV